MGAALSGLSESDENGRGPGLGDIPEDCVTCVILHLDPPAICNLARLNRAFRGAASSDAVWETKLPPNYQDLLDLLPPEKYQNLSKKDIFALLCNPIPLEDKNKDKLVWVDRTKGKVCMSISAKALTITGIEDRRYWNWIPAEESRFQTVAYLQQIWWFEVSGAVKFPLPPGTYAVSFRLHLGRFTKRLGRRVCNHEHTHGWDIKPVRFELTTSHGQQAHIDRCVEESEKDEMLAQKRSPWSEYTVGEFIVPNDQSVTEVRFSMKQIDCTHSKGGLCLDSVSITPVIEQKKKE